MITALFALDKAQNVRSFSFSGHAGYTSCKCGQDIVCAGLTAVALSVMGYLENVLQVQLESTIDETSGLIECKVKDFPAGDMLRQEKITAALAIVLEGARMIAESYSGHVVVKKTRYRED